MSEGGPFVSCRDAAIWLRSVESGHGDDTCVIVSLLTLMRHGSAPPINLFNSTHRRWDSGEAVVMVATTSRPDLALFARSKGIFLTMLVDYAFRDAEGIQRSGEQQ